MLAQTAGIVTAFLIWPLVLASKFVYSIRHCRKTRSGFERLIFRLTASGCIDDKTNIACFAVFARRKTARSRADDGVFRQSLVLDVCGGFVILWEIKPGPNVAGNLFRREK